MKFTLSTWKFWLWPAAALAVLSLHFWFPDTPTGTAHDSYSPAAPGQKAFYRLISQHPANEFVMRNRRPLAQLSHDLFPEEVLCILGPERSPSPEEWSLLVDWVRNGGSLVYAFRGDKPQEVPALRVKFEPGYSGRDDLEPSTALVPTNDVAWWTDGRLDAPTATPLVQYDGTLQAVQCRYGAGTVVFVASSLPFSNQLLTYGDNSVLALRLLEAAGPPEFVIVDESLNDSGKSKVVGILFDPLLRPVTIQILLLTLLFGWWHTRRFGPLAPVAVAPRQNIVEHTDMVGNWYWKSHDGRAVLRIYLRQLASLLKLKAFRGNEDRVLEPVARRAGRTTASLRKELKEAFDEVRSKQVDRRTAARMIRQLSLIRKVAQVNRTSTKS